MLKRIYWRFLDFNILRKNAVLDVFGVLTFWCLPFYEKTQFWGQRKNVAKLRLAETKKTDPYSEYHILYAAATRFESGDKTTKKMAFGISLLKSLIADFGLAKVGVQLGYVPIVLKYKNFSLFVLPIFCFPLSSRLFFL